jgi:UDP:flavonoid glycosyltransferase YjiC (YdhE family)
LRIYFAPCGIGLGHVGRSLEIAKRLKEEGCEILFSTYADALEVLRDDGFRFVEAPTFRYWVWPDGTPDPWRTLKWLSGKLLGKFLRQVKFEVKNIAKFKPNLVFSDSRLSTVYAGWLLGKKVVTMLNQFHVIGPGFVYYRILPKISDIFSFTFLATGWGLSSKILVPDLPPPNSVSAANLRIPPILKNKVEFIGPILPVKPENLPDKETLRKKLGFDDRPLIYVAASGHGWERIWFGKKLVKYFSDFPEKYQIIISLGLKNSSNIIRNKNLTVYSWLSERFEILKVCDLVVCKGGHTTLTQALAYGKPMLLIPTPEQTEQILNAKTVEKLGVGKVVDQRWLSKKLLLSTVEEMFSSDIYWKKAEKISRIASKFDALKSAVKTVLGLI